MISEIKNLPFIDFAEGPEEIFLTLTPQDYDPSKQWYLKNDDAERAWDITTGSSNIKIAINDFLLTRLQRCIQIW